MWIIILRTISSIVYLGGLVMTGIGGWYDYQQAMTVSSGPFGLSILLWGIIIAALGSVILIAQLWYRVHKLENEAVSIDVYPNGFPMMDIGLVVHNKSNIPATFNAIMGCEFDMGEGMRRVHQSGLQNVSMCWEGSGTSSETIDGDGKKILKLCQKVESAKADGAALHYMEFYKIESASPKLVKCATTSDGSQIPKVNVYIQLTADKPIKGQKKWHFLVYYVEGNYTLGIYSVPHKGKRLLGNILGVRKYNN